MKFLPVFGALVLSACSTDVFVAPEGGTDSGGNDANADAAPPPTPIIKCANTTCTGHDCCSAANWDVATCGAAVTEGTATCLRYLECDNAADCVQGQVCCANEVNDPVANKLTVTSAKCATTCSGTNTVQLCTADLECLQGNCQGNQGLPSWLQTCQ